MFRFVYRFLQNPLLSLPQPAYEEPAFVYQPGGKRGSTIVWVTAPELTETILQNRNNDFVKTPLEKRVFRRTLGESVLTADGNDWRWQRRAIAPLFRHSEILGYVPAMAAAGEVLIGQWRQQSRRRRDIEEDMTDVTFAVIARTMMAGGVAGRKRGHQARRPPVPGRHSLGDDLGAPARSRLDAPSRALRRLDRTAKTMRNAVADIVARQTCRWWRRQ